MAAAAQHFAAGALYCIAIGKASGGKKIERPANAEVCRAPWHPRGDARKARPTAGRAAPP